MSMGRSARATSAWPMSSRPEGTRGSAACAGGRLSGAGSGTRSNSTESSAAPETPSTVEWCILAMSPIRPSASPSTIHISHSGLDRSSWRPVMSPARSASWRSPPGRGTAASRTW